MLGLPRPRELGSAADPTLTCATVSSRRLWQPPVPWSLGARHRLLGGVCRGSEACVDLEMDSRGPSAEQVWPAGRGRGEHTRHLIQLLQSTPTGVPPPPGDAAPKVDTHTRGRPADQMYAWANARAPMLNMPFRALEAYAYAARVAEVENPSCHIGWTTLAAIGFIESRNGTYRGATIAPNGDVRPPIRGVPLDGSDGNQLAVAGPNDTTFTQWGPSNSYRRRGGCTGSTLTTMES
jgi:hypothetical protein